LGGGGVLGWFRGGAGGGETGEEGAEELGLGYEVVAMEGEDEDLVRVSVCVGAQRGHETHWNVAGFWYTGSSPFE